MSIKSDIREAVSALTGEAGVKSAASTILGSVNPLFLLGNNVSNDLTFSDLASGWIPSRDFIKLRNKETKNKHIQNSAANKRIAKLQSQNSQSLLLDKSKVAKLDTIAHSQSEMVQLQRSSMNLQNIQHQESIAQLKNISSNTSKSTKLMFSLMKLMSVAVPLMLSARTAYGMIKDTRTLKNAREVIGKEGLTKGFTSVFTNPNFKAAVSEDLLYTLNKVFKDTSMAFAINLVKKYIPEAKGPLNLVVNTLDLLNKPFYINEMMKDLLHIRTPGRLANLKEKLRAVKEGTYIPEFQLHNLYKDLIEGGYLETYMRKETGITNKSLQATYYREAYRRQLETMLYSKAALKDMKLMIGETNQTYKKFMSIVLPQLTSDLTYIAQQVRINLATKGVPLGGKEEKNERAKAYLDSLKNLLDPQISIELAKRLANKPNLSEDIIRSELEKIAKEKNLTLSGLIKQASKTRIYFDEQFRKLFNAKSLPSLVGYLSSLNNPISDLAMPFIREYMPFTLTQKIQSKATEMLMNRFPALKPFVSIYYGRQLRKTLFNNKSLENLFGMASDYLKKKIAEASPEVLNRKIGEFEVEKGRKATKDEIEKLRQDLLRQQAKAFATLEENLVQKGTKTFRRVKKSPVAQALIDSLAKENLPLALAIQLASGNTMGAIKTALGRTKIFKPIIDAMQIMRYVYRGVRSVVEGTALGISKSFKDIRLDYQQLHSLEKYQKAGLFKKGLMNIGVAWRSIRGVLSNIKSSILRRAIKLFTGVNWPIEGLDNVENLLVGSMIETGAIGKGINDVKDIIQDKTVSILDEIKHIFSNSWDDITKSFRVKIISKEEEKRLKKKKLEEEKIKRKTEKKKEELNKAKEEKDRVTANTINEILKQKEKLEKDKEYFSTFRNVSMYQASQNEFVRRGILNQQPNSKESGIHPFRAIKGAIRGVFSFFPSVWTLFKKKVGISISHAASLTDQLLAMIAGTLLKEKKEESEGSSFVKTVVSKGFSFISRLLSNLLGSVGGAILGGLGLLGLGKLLKSIVSKGWNWIRGRNTSIPEETPQKESPTEKSPEEVTSTPKEETTVEGTPKETPEVTATPKEETTVEGTPKEIPEVKPTTITKEIPPEEVPIAEGIPAETTTGELATDVLSTAGETISSLKSGLIGLGGMAAGMGLQELSNIIPNKYHKTKVAVNDIGRMVNYASTGAGLGAAIGSVVPGLGTGVGMAVGGALGAAYGAYKNIADYYKEKKEEESQKSNVELSTPVTNAVFGNSSILDMDKEGYFQRMKDSNKQAFLEALNEFYGQSYNKYINPNVRLNPSTPNANTVPQKKQPSKANNNYNIIIGNYPSWGYGM